MDIAQSLGANKNLNQIHVGFALETENESENAQAKLKKKNFDLIVLNSMKEKGAGFRLDTNKVTIFTNKAEKIESPLAPKTEIAEFILDEIKKLELWEEA